MCGILEITVIFGWKKLFSILLGVKRRCRYVAWVVVIPRQKSDFERERERERERALNF